MRPVAPAVPSPPSATGVSPAARALSSGRRWNPESFWAGSGSRSVGPGVSRGAASEGSAGLPPPSRAHTRCGSSSSPAARGPASHLSLPARPQEGLRIPRTAPLNSAFSTPGFLGIDRRLGRRALRETLGISCRSKLLMKRAVAAECGRLSPGMETRALVLLHCKGS